CMSTRSSSSNLIPHFFDPESVIRARQRNLGDPSRLLDFEEVNMNSNNVQGPPPAGSPQNHNGPPGPNLHMQANSRSPNDRGAVPADDKWTGRTDRSLEHSGY
ncbi:hypothetical protein Tco_0171926, partial [Tanacetum coccineum]